ncbi:uncharacterized protein BHQ10_002518 [Talaromyces amestolkiae]|uniref:Enoyl reductase (ER) domain-containing protein n=1 Tax=Talaromyces amestolkiae TaxID=1196081 RepID=A0A364KSI1_TALAM|nr:uncharacterized protein BHQ10_002518 [Talaromyces amestolkiae]RAO66506.1 hypothetical protein BHQ10_002518 [Talaromyces amestolkiae]
MAPAKTVKQWTVKGNVNGFDELKLDTAAFPECGENEVLVKLGAASLNYRDLMIPKAGLSLQKVMQYEEKLTYKSEVVEVGSKVTKWKKGDQVVTLFNQGHQYGPMTVAAASTGLGGALDGTLREHAVFNENGLVRKPDNLNTIEASTLSCAALTAWNALYGLKPLKPGQTVLVLGTGGVSIFGLQFAKAAGAKVIATTSSEAKAEKMRKLGADHVVNYKTDANWGETVRKLSVGGEGVDHVLEIGGPATLKDSLRAVKFEGVISIIGQVGSSKREDVPQIIDALSNVCIFRGVYVGSREQMEDMVQAIEMNNIHPVVDDEVFDFEKAREAYQYQWDQKHFGNVVIKI